MWSLSLVLSECSLSGRSQGHVSNFYILDVENFSIASRQYTGDMHNSVRSRFVYDTYRTIEATRSRHGWVHMFIIYRPTVSLLLHNFDLFRTCRSSFCTVAWQLARFQLTLRIARSLSDELSFLSPNVSATSRQLVTSRSQSRLGLITSRLGLGRKGLVHIPVCEIRFFYGRSG